MIEIYFLCTLAPIKINHKIIINKKRKKGFNSACMSAERVSLNQQLDSYFEGERFILNVQLILSRSDALIRWLGTLGHLIFE